MKVSPPRHSWLLEKTDPEQIVPCATPGAGKEVDTEGVTNQLFPDKFIDARHCPREKKKK